MIAGEEVIGILETQAASGCRGSGYDTYCTDFSLFSIESLACLQVRVAALVQGVLDISGASPRRYFFEVLRHFATAELEIDRLEYFATPDGRNDLYTYNQKEGEWTTL